MFTRRCQRMWIGAWLNVWMLLLPGMVVAQEMRMDLLADGELIIGVVSHADGTPAADVAVQIALASTPAMPVATLQTDTVGIFTYTGEYNTGYRISSGDVQADITLGAAPARPFTWPPIYITLGILMLLSLVPARMLRRKDL